MTYSKKLASLSLRKHEPKESMNQFLTWTWDPAAGQFGLLPMLATSLLLATTASSLAFFWAMAINCFLSTDETSRFKTPVAALVHVMAAVPSLVYAVLGVLCIVPFLRQWTNTGGFGLLAAVLTLTLFITPQQVLLSRSLLSDLMKRSDLTAQSLGLSKLQSFLHIVLPQAKASLFETYLLGYVRALGDTMIALLVAGNAAQSPNSWLTPVRSLTAHIALVSGVDTLSQTFQSVFVVSAILLGSSLLLISLVHILHRLSRRVAE
jgi:phosphate transport system permease protein